MIWLLVACGSIVTHDTARIATTHTELKTSAVVSKNANPLVGVLPIPSLDVVYRRRLGPDADIGVKMLGGAPGFDVRKRMVRRERFDLTVSSAAAGAYLPTGGSFGVSGQGFVDLTTPILATTALTPDVSLTVAGRPGLQWLAITSTGEGFVTEGVNRVIALLGAGVRLEFARNRRGFAIAADIMARPGEGNATGWAISLQSLGFRQRARGKTHRAIKRSAREARR